MTPAAQLVAELRARGVELVAAGDRLRYRPVDAVTPNEIEVMRAFKPEILRILTGVLHERVDAFRHAMAEWFASGRPGVPLLALPGVTPALGRCVSCGVTLPGDRQWRCELCLAAVVIVLGSSHDDEDGGPS